MNKPSDRKPASGLQKIALAFILVSAWLWLGDQSSAKGYANAQSDKARSQWRVRLIVDAVATLVGPCLLAWDFAHRRKR